MGGLLSTKCHSDLKTCRSDLNHCKAELQQHINPMLGTTHHRHMPDNPKGENKPIVGGKRTQRHKKNRKRTKHRQNW